MKSERSFLWKSPLMEIVSTEVKVSESTEKPYAVIKARMSSRTKPCYSNYRTWSKKAYTLMCFSEPLFVLFEAGNFHLFEGELSFDWGNTWLKITKLYDDEGNRLLRPQKTIHQDNTHKEVRALVEKNGEVERLRNIERKRRLDAGWPCTQECSECEDLSCDFLLPY
jgi:hypothetical protein